MKNFLLGLGVFSIIILPFFTSAQENTSTRKETKVEVVSTVEIYNAAITGQYKNEFKIRFDLANGKQSQADVRYAVNLVKVVGESQDLVDEEIYPEIVSISENEIQAKEITYTVPEYLRGSYDLWLMAKDSSGLVLSLNPVASIKVSGTGQYIGVEQGSCKLSIEGGSEEYSLTQGVDIGENESLQIDCLLRNNYHEEVNLIPSFKTYKRSTFGELLDERSDESQSFTMSAQEEKNIAINLPTLSEAQAYDLVLSFNREADPIRVHYVIQGLSGTLQNVKLDKDHYNEGERANISVFWTSSADNFPGSRSQSLSGDIEFLAQAEIYNKKGDLCGKSSSQALLESSQVLGIDIKRECLNPLVEVFLKDEEGNILDRKNFSLKTTVSGQENLPKFDEEGSPGFIGSKGIVFLVMLAVFISVSLFVVIKKRKMRSNFGLFIFIAFSVLLIGSQKSEAASIALTSTWCDGAEECDAATSFVFTASLNKLEYYPGETVIVSGTGLSGACSNAGTIADMEATVNGVSKKVFDFTPFVGGNFKADYATFTAPSSPGSYIANIYGSYGYDDGGTYVQLDSGSANITYFVVAPSVDGSCGPSDGGIFTSPPGSGLCSSGTASSVTTNPSSYDWLCEGTDDGYDASCSATREVLTPSASLLTDPPNITIEPGQNALLRWNTSNVDSCEALSSPVSGQWEGPIYDYVEGSRVVSPSESTTYYLNCTGPWGNANDSENVDIDLCIAVAGSCGNASGEILTSKPTEDLCLTGVASEVSESGSIWSWNCSGICGAGSASCSATKTSQGGVTGGSYREVAP